MTEPGGRRTATHNGTKTMTDSTARPSRFFSDNPDKAWAEKLFLGFIPVWFAFNVVVQAMGWLNTGNFWNITQNLLMWIPYCVLLPAFLRRNSGIPWHQSYWFKFNLFIFVWTFFATYFHTEYFFQVLGMRYRFPEVTLYLDSALCGPDEISALATHQKIPPSMYLNATAFFMVYHASAVVAMRAVRSFTTGLGELAGKFAWAGIVAITAIFWAWGETAFYFQLAPNDGANVWYEDLPKMIAHGSWFYSLYFIVSFPIVYRLDERREAERWPLSRVVIEACAVGMVTLLFIDLATWYVGGKL
jgi:cycloeucalenol cycloisomerase